MLLLSIFAVMDVLHLPMYLKITLFIAFCIVVGIQLFYYLFFFKKFAAFRTPQKTASQEYPVSVVICARDEANNLVKNLPGVLVQDYKTTHEVIVVNDFSTDGTETLVLNHKLKCRLLNLSDYVTENLNSYKKKAIETGINHSSGELIICTDSDCTMRTDWIKPWSPFMKRKTFSS